MNKKNNYNWPLIGNEHISDWLGRALAEKRLQGFFILNGPDNLGKTTLAKYLSQIMLCEGSDDIRPCGQCLTCRSFQAKDFEQIAHGDFHLIKKEKDKKNISVAQIRELIDILSMSSFLSGYKIGIVKHADAMSQEAANALLKTLEEPRPKVLIMLITQDADRLPPTIRSRAQILNFRPVSSQKIYEYLVEGHKTPRISAKNIARMSLGRPALAVKLLEDQEFFEKYTRAAREFLNFFSMDVNERFRSLDQLIEGKSGQEKAVSAQRLLEIWSGVVRDLLLMDFGHFNLVQYEKYQEDLNRTQPFFSARQALAYFQAAQASSQMIRDNVNPVLALQTVLTSL